ncbi:MAG TPA: protein-ADP-ribose hydrolase [Gemmatimonadaceae bacterium]|nr:protein-ADP-ribose hydrolase [Gemmatimonadaceae bacterium]
MPLHLADYRDLVALDHPVEPAEPAAVVERPGLLGHVVRHLLAERTGARLGVDPDIPDARDVVELRRLLRALLTVRGAEPLPPHVHLAIDRIMQAERDERGTIAAASLPRVRGHSSIALWQGDITTLGVDAIVNAANAEMLGCFRPFHACIDNAIHAAAGPRLREDCGRIMALQGHAEPNGQAKATRGYHLPASFVVHTVGPIVRNVLQPEHEAVLAGCYRACLDLARELQGVRSIAFCAIATGVFGFPKVAAARIAVRTVAEWLEAHPDALDLVVFNVFTEADRAVYQDVLEEGA